MSIKDRLIHRARKHVIIGTNKIGMLACCFYISLKLAYLSGEENFRYWETDLVIVSVLLIVLLAWETLMWAFLFTHQKCTFFITKRTEKLNDNSQRLH